jgi:hydroxymethylglutaryl-CoA lyase
MSTLPASVTIIDDTMREGLQIESASISVDAKLRLLDALGDTGAKVISIGSFAHPKWTPQMACIDEIAQRFVPKPGITYTAAVFNKAGFNRADSYFPKIDVRRKGKRPGVSIEMCDSFARRNYNRTQAQQIDALDAIIDGARAAGVPEASVGIGNPFGSNFEGPFSHDQRMTLLEMLIGKWQAAGIAVTRVSLNEAMGWNMPHLVRQTMTAIRDRWPAVTDFHLHLHNQRGAALASYYEALQLGAREFDTCLGGMGGCPYCGNGRSAGHVPTEDFVDLCHEMGVDTGYDLTKLIDAVAVAQEVVGHELYGHVSKSGPRPRGQALYPIDMPFVETLDEAAHFRKGAQVYAGQLSPWKENDALLRR